ncbi:hypothetical protein SeMB42_g06348 [Synchytrium endobioticum]|uniref:Cyclin-like domain-containing protein n=1 Tax=Synchytrium endobioticum TaxID=286115 RepID=A0A507CIT9_9FUNG|nr:hypothetical protein SeMB42_g06348 [Synchytrium endobioticum]TPX44556.1 hypothetical protein SeLEV6574_g04433 [Synchytrium endobioticum]
MALEFPPAVVSLSLQNTVASYEQLLQTPSQRDAITTDFEMQVRAFGCELIESAGILLKLPQVAISTAEVLLHRFYYTSSLSKFGIRDIAMGAIFLASKVEECPRRIAQMVLVFHHLVSTRAHGVPPANYKPVDHLSPTWLDYKDGMIAAEINILAKLGFNVQVEHPYGYMINYLQSLGLSDDEEFSQIAWNFLNDSYRTNVSVCYQPWTIACAVIYLVSRIRAIPLPKNPHWYALFDAELEDMENIAGHIMWLYKKAPVRNLPTTVSELKAYLAKDDEIAETNQYGNRVAGNEEEKRGSAPRSPRRDERRRDDDRYRHTRRPEDDNYEDSRRHCDNRDSRRRDDRDDNRRDHARRRSPSRRDGRR